MPVTGIINTFHKMISVKENSHAKNVWLFDRDFDWRISGRGIGVAACP